VSEEFVAMTLMYPEIDYRVDHTKLIFRRPDTSPVPDGYVRPEPQLCPPIQCTGRLHKSPQERYSWWERLLNRSLRVETGEYLEGERCNGYLGHWEYEGQRFHFNGFGDKWPVTAADTAPYNPDPGAIASWQP